MPRGGSAVGPGKSRREYPSTNADVYVEQRLADGLADARKLYIERMERPQALPRRFRRKEVTEKAVIVVAPHLFSNRKGRASP